MVHRFTMQDIQHVIPGITIQSKNAPSEEQLAWDKYFQSNRETGRKRKRSVSWTEQKGPKYQLFRSGVMVHMGKARTHIAGSSHTSEHGQVAHGQLREAVQVFAVLQQRQVDQGARLDLQRGCAREASP